MTLSFPEYTLSERISDGCVHVLGVSASLIAASILITFAITSLPALSTASVLIYTAGMVAVFCFSAAYNLVSAPRIKGFLRRCDHAAIYVKIAATYTPFALVKMGGVPGFALMGFVWTVGIIGVIAKIGWPAQLARTSYVLYLAQGWACVAALNPLSSAVSERVLVLLIVGGVLYTLGVVFHLWQSLRHHNAIWHGFVLTASACHFAAVADALTA